MGFNCKVRFAGADSGATAGTELLELLTELLLELDSLLLEELETDDAVDELLFEEEPPPPPQAVAKRADKIIIQLAKRISSPFYVLFDPKP